MGMWRFIKRNIRFARVYIRKQIYLSKDNTLQLGNLRWLIETEQKYGGYIGGLPRRVMSEHHDLDTKAKLERRLMQGGDRMLFHDYGKVYARYLAPFVSSSDSFTLIELGILKGTGLAIWCDLFESGRIIGLDIDLEYFNANIEKLKSLGAFTNNMPELHYFDQYEDNHEYLGDILGDDKIDIFIDDGVHDSEAIIKTMECVVPYLSERFVYFVEDNKWVHSQIRQSYPDFTVASYRRFTVVTSGPIQQ